MKVEIKKLTQTEIDEVLAQQERVEYDTETYELTVTFNAPLVRVPANPKQIIIEEKEMTSCYCDMCGQEIAEDDSIFVNENEDGLVFCSMDCFLEYYGDMDGE